MSAHWSGVGLLTVVTVFYAGYNLLVKASGDHVPASATSTVLATLCLQAAALLVSLVFLVWLVSRGGHSLQLSGRAYLWAMLAGVCIGFAEIGYFYLFAGIGGGRPMPANVAVPVILSGTIVIALLISASVLKESFSWNQVFGSGVIVCGILLFFIRGEP